MLQCRDLEITMVRDMRVLVQGISFTLNEGDRMALIGEEGNGKSTLLKLLCDPALTEGYAAWSGEIVRSGERLGYLPQELPPARRGLTVYEFSCDSGLLDAAPRELSALANQMGLGPDLLYSDQRMDTLSGGEKVKVQLTCLLLGHPTCLLLDEPSNDLDLATLEWLEQFLLTCGLKVLFISHDEVLLERTATRVLHLEQLRRKTAARCTVANLPYRTYVDGRLAALERQDQVARKEQAEFERQQARWRELYQQVDRAQASISRQDPHGGQLLKKKMKAVKSMERRFDREQEQLTRRPDTEESIFLRFDETVSLPQGKTVLDLDLPELRAGDRVLARNVKLHAAGPVHLGIVGRNGAGKTTLLRLIAQDLLARRDLRAAYMPQNYGELLDLERTPVEFLAPRGDKESVTRARTYLGSMKYTALEMEHRMGELSGGQRAKLLILSMILAGSNVLVLDEPTRNLSPLSSPVLRGVLRDYRGAILSVSHDRKYLEEVCEKVFELREDGIRARSPREQRG